MFSKPVRDAYFTQIRDRLAAFTILSKIFENEELDPDTDLIPWIVKNDKESNLSKNPWIGILWKRGPMEEDTEGFGSRRTMPMAPDTSNPDNPVATDYKLRYGKVNYEIAYFSNSPDYLELFEASLFALSNGQESLDVIYTYINPTVPVKVKISEFKFLEFNKEKRPERGTLIKSISSLNFTYPVGVINNLLPLIKDIVITLKFDGEE
jgi:hypothetical protein